MTDGSVCVAASHAEEDERATCARDRGLALTRWLPCKSRLVLGIGGLSDVFEFDDEMEWNGMETEVARSSLILEAWRAVVGLGLRSGLTLLWQYTRRLG